VKNGFTLLELMMGLAIVAILVTMAYPTYSNYIIKSRRTDGQIALLDLSSRMERFYSQNNSYQGATLTALGISPLSPSGFYRLAIISPQATSFIIQATPIKSQVNDTDCGALTYNQLGEKGAAGTLASEECW